MNKILTPTPLAFQTPPATPAWTVKMLGTLRLVSVDGEQNVMRFRTQTTGSLLAYLAFFIGDVIPRQVAIDAIWPEINFESGQNRLRIALSTLRGQLSRAPLTFSDIFLPSDKAHIGFSPNIVTTDVALFENALNRAENARDTAARIACLDEAIALYGGDLLVGRYENWIEFERDRLRQRYEAALAQRETLLAGSILRERALPGSFKSGLGETDVAQTFAGRKTLPETPTRFFGRQLEVAFLADLLCGPIGRVVPIGQTKSNEGGPLVTLTGMGGIGKSRLALEVARRLLPRFDGRVWFVELAGVRDANAFWVTLRDTLDLAKEGDKNARNQVAGQISAHPCLLVLDNVETFAHADPNALAECVGALRSKEAGLPLLALLCTSRQVLTVPGETVLPLGSLLTPATWQGGKAELGTDGDGQAALELFADRARAVRFGFVVTETNEKTLRRLCETLDGIPLAIELAAARLSIMSPKQLLAHLEQRFLLLKTVRTDVPARHRSLQAAIETSYESLRPELRAAVSALSVFRGGWTIAGAASVCGLSIAQTWDTLSELSARSLVQGIGGDDSLRFRMLETIREFMEIRLDEGKKGEAAAARQRHRRFFTELSVSAAPHIELGKKDAQVWLDVLEADHDNLRAALDAPTLERERFTLPNGLYRFWFVRNFADEGKHYLRRALGATHVSPFPSDSAQAWNNLGALVWATGDLPEAQSAFENALELYRKTDNELKIASVLNNLGIVCSQNGYFEEGRRFYNECLSIYRDLGETTKQSAALTNLGGLLILAEDFDAARAALEKSVKIQRKCSDKTAVLRTVNNLSELALRQRDYSSAIDAVLEGLQIRQEIGDWSTLWEPFATAATALSKESFLYEAAVLWGAAQARLDGERLTVAPVERLKEREIVARFRMMPGGVEAAKAAERLGKAMDVQEAIQFACRALEKARSPTRP